MDQNGCGSQPVYVPGIIPDLLEFGALHSLHFKKFTEWHCVTYVLVLKLLDITPGIIFLPAVLHPPIRMHTVGKSDESY